MSAETIRRAATLMRERATANIITPGPWGFAGVDGQGFAVHRGEHDTVALYANRPDAEHIASWHPDVALPVADWLENAAEDLDMQAPDGDLVKNWDMRVHINGAKALVVARAYLGVS